MSDLDVVEALVVLRLVDGKGEARRAIATGGVFVNDLPVDGPSYRVRVGDVVRVGKTQQAILHSVSAHAVEQNLPHDPRSSMTSFVDAHAVERNLPRDQRQAMIASWAEMAFGREQATSLPQRGLRLLEEAIEAFQACGGDEAMAHKLVAFVFARPAGTVGQELGGVAVTVLALAAAAGLSADEEECREVHRVLSKPIGEFRARNESKNAAGFLQLVAGKELPRNPCCGNAGTHGEGNREYCSTCGADLGARTFP